MLEKGTGMLLVGVAAPSEKNLVPWLMEHPSYQVYLHTKGGKSKSSFAVAKIFLMRLGRILVVHVATFSAQCSMVLVYLHHMNVASNFYHDIR